VPWSPRRAVAAGGLACVFVPDPDAPGRRRQIVAELEPEGAPEIVSLGPTVAWQDATTSLRRAAAAFRLAAAGRIPLRSAGAASRCSP